MRRPRILRAVSLVRTSSHALVASLVAMAMPAVAHASDVITPDGVYGRVRGATARALEAGGGGGFVPAGGRQNPVYIPERRSITRPRPAAGVSTPSRWSRQ